MDTTLQQVSDAIKAMPVLETEIAALNIGLSEVNARLDNLIKYVESLTLPQEPEQDPEPEPVNEVVLACVNDGTVIINDKLIAAMNEASAKGASVRIPAGTYWVKPGIKVTTSLIGEKAIFITKEMAPYNIMFQTVGSGKRITGLIFDQTGDAAMLPDSKNYKGSHIIHIPDGDDIMVDNCEFYGYGVTSILSNPFDGFGKNLIIDHNKFFWKRKVNSYYDVSVINADGINVLVSDNIINVSKDPAVADWRAETGIEFHCCSGVVKNNTIANCVNGILHVAWPTLYKNYNSGLRGKTEIYDNSILWVCRGIVSWGRMSQLPIENQDIDIYNNNINLHLEKRGSSYYYPSIGVGLVDGGVDNSIFEFVSINRNIIKTTCAEGLNPKTILNYGPISNGLGGIFLMTNNSCINVAITENNVNFPFAATQIRALGTNKHQNILIKSNVFDNCSIYRGYLSGGFDGIYNFENVDGVEVQGNTILGTPIKIRTDGKNVTNIIYN